VDETGVFSMERKISFIGVGKMGGSLLERLISTGLVSKDNVMACDINRDRLNDLRQRLWIMISQDNKEGVRFGDIVVIAVMPKVVRSVLEEVRQEVLESKTIVSVAALIPIETIENIIQAKIGAVRIMPNIPSLVGSGFNLVCFGNFLKEQDKQFIRNMFAVWGEYREVDEDKMNLYTVISAMGPTYFTPFLDVLVRFGVEKGLTEAEAREVACFTLKGTAELISKVPSPIEDLKNMITSQPLKEKEQELKILFKETLEKTLNEIEIGSRKLSQAK
jgi:pyrroline-5-carboxylate reductase